MRRLGWRGIESVNEMRPTVAIHWLYETCSSRSWAVRVAASRPYRDDQALYARADAILAELTDADLFEALAGHPNRRRRSVESMDADLAAYERKFGHPFVSEEQTAELRQEALRTRLGNSPDVERRVVRSELRAINRARLEHALIPVHELVDTV